METPLEINYIVCAYSLFDSRAGGNHEKQGGCALSRSNSLIGSRIALWNVIRTLVKMLFTGNESDIATITRYNAQGGGLRP